MKRRFIFFGLFVALGYLLSGAVGERVDPWQFVAVMAVVAMIAFVSFLEGMFGS